MSDGPSPEAAKRRAILHRLLAALVHHGDHDEVDAELTRAADWLADNDLGELRSVLAPAPGIATQGYMIMRFSDDDWTAEAQKWEHPNPGRAWKVFRAAPAGTELTSVGEGVTRRLAVRRGPKAVRFMHVDELALEGPAERDALEAWLKFARMIDERNRPAGSPPPSPAAPPQAPSLHRAPPPVPPAQRALPAAPAASPPAAAPDAPSVHVVIPAAVTIPHHGHEPESPPQEGRP